MLEIVKPLVIWGSRLKARHSGFEPEDESSNLSSPSKESNKQMSNKVKIWRTMSGDVVEDMLAEVVKATADGQRVVHVGCDSQQKDKETEFTEVIILLIPGKGGRVLYNSEKVPRIKSLRERLLNEVMRSVNIGFDLSTVLSEDVELVIHVDANPNLKFKSSKVLPELVGYVMGQGFTCLTKPDSWAAMHVADHIVKHKHNRDIRADRSGKYNK